MTTKKEKKGVKKVKPVKSGTTAKSVKGSGAGSERKKVVVKNPKVGEIDKEKMAAFFSAVGLKEPALSEKSESVAPVPAEAPPAAVENVAAAEPETPPAVEVEKPIVTDPVPEAEVVVTSSPQPENNNLKEEKGEIEMTTTETAETSSKKSSSGSFSTMPLFIILLCLAAFWFYYISSAPLKNAAAVKVEPSQTKLQLLESQVKTLQAEVGVLQAKLAALQCPAREAKVKKAVPEKAPVRDASFDKAPTPFWRTMEHPHAEQLQKSRENRAAAATVKTEKVDSFSKAPVPFWRKAETKNGVSTKKGTEVNKNRDPSFDKAPVPFWRK